MIKVVYIYMWTSLNYPTVSFQMVWNIGVHLISLSVHVNVKGMVCYELQTFLLITKL